MIPSIGAYLDLPPGKDIAPGAVAKWMVKISEYSMTMCTSNICIIFGQDGTIGDYPVYVEPADPPDPCALAVKKKWDIRYTAWFNNTEQLEQDKKKLYGYMAGQMSESSKNRTKETTVGNEASIEKEPRKLLQAILATHLGDSRLGADHHLFNIEQAYHALVMGPNEPLINYLQNMRSILSGIEQAYARAGREQPDDYFPEGQMGLKFTMGLNHHYNEYKSFYTNNLKPWPTNLDDAYSEAASWRSTISTRARQRVCLPWKRKIRTRKRWQ